MTYANLFLPTWELGRFSLGNLDDFLLGTWTDFAWELGRFSLGNLDGFYLGTWTVFTWELGQLFFTLPIGMTTKKRDAMHCVSTYFSQGTI